MRIYQGDRKCRSIDNDISALCLLLLETGQFRK
jgi:hypothetical protein